MNPDTLPDEPSDVDPEPAERAEPSDVDPEPAERAEPSDVDPEPAEQTEPSDLEPDTADPADDSDLEFTDMPCTDAGADADESQWEAFLPDDDAWDPEPEPGDFWIENRLLASASADLMV